MPQGMYPHKAIKGIKNPRWKGDKAKSGTIHQWLYATFGKPNRCESCGLSDPSRKYHWANVNGHKYSRNRSDYKMMCCKCHTNFDVATGARRIKSVEVNCAYCGKPFFIYPYRLKRIPIGGFCCCNAHANSVSTSRRYSKKPYQLCLRFK